MEKRVTFATACWERDWKHILLDPDYLEKKQIAYQSHEFSEKLLIINNVENLSEVKKAADRLVARGVITRYVVAEDVLGFFGLKKGDFNEWQYWNALAPLNAIYYATGDYLLYLTGDVYLKRPVKWIDAAVRWMEKDSNKKVANLVWNERLDEAKKESWRQSWNFYVSKNGFSDQMFLVKRDDFRRPIYSEVRVDGAHFPRGDVWEKRVFSYMKNRGWERITFKGGSYTHENIG